MCWAFALSVPGARMREEGEEAVRWYNPCPWVTHNLSEIAASCWQLVTCQRGAQSMSTHEELLHGYNPEK